MSKLAIFPSSGALGSNIYTHLFKSVHPANLVLIARKPEKIPIEYLKADVTTRQADYNSPESLKDVFNDVSALVLISYPSIEYEHRFKVHKLAIDAAIGSTPGVSHIFYTSLAFGGNCTPHSVAHVMQAHLATEKYLKSLTSVEAASLVRPDRSFSFTAIREGICSGSFPMYIGFFDLQNPVDEVRIPHDGSGPGIAWAKRDELGEATSRLVNEYIDDPDKFSYKNKVVLLSGPRAWTLAETVKLLGEVVGKEVKLTQVGPDEYVSDPVVRRKIYSHGPGDPAREWMTVFDAVRRGETGEVSIELRRLLGREPEDFAKTVGSDGSQVNPDSSEEKMAVLKMCISHLLANPRIGAIGTAIPFQSHPHLQLLFLASVASGPHSLELLFNPGPHNIIVGHIGVSASGQHSDSHSGCDASRRA